MKNLLSIILLLSFVSCATQGKKERSKFNQVHIKNTLIKNATSKSRIIEEFGAPHMINSDSENNEEWVYSHTYKGTDSSSLLMGGASFISMALVGIGGDISKSETSSRTLTLTINFNKDNTVKDYRFSSSSI